MTGVYEWEGVVRHINARASGDGWAIARQLQVEVHAVRNLRQLAVAAVCEGRDVVGYRASLPRPYANHGIVHEIGHIFMKRLGVEDSEDGADYIAAGVLMPAKDFRVRLREVGEDPTQLALPFGVTETSAALRLGEVNGVPVAVVAPLIVRVRGPEEWNWGSDPVVRQLSRTGGAGVIKAKLRDDSRRVWLRAA